MPRTRTHGASLLEYAALLGLVAAVGGVGLVGLDRPVGDLYAMAAGALRADGDQPPGTRDGQGCLLFGDGPDRAVAGVGDVCIHTGGGSDELDATAAVEGIVAHDTGGAGGSLRFGPGPDRLDSRQGGAVFMGEGDDVARVALDGHERPLELDMGAGHDRADLSFGPLPFGRAWPRITAGGTAEIHATCAQDGLEVGARAGAGITLTGGCALRALPPEGTARIAALDVPGVVGRLEGPWDASLRVDTTTELPQILHADLATLAGLTLTARVTTALDHHYRTGPGARPAFLDLASPDGRVTITGAGGGAITGRLDLPGGNLALYPDPHTGGFAALDVQGHVSDLTIMGCLEGLRVGTPGGPRDLDPCPDASTTHPIPPDATFVEATGPAGGVRIDAARLSLDTLTIRTTP